MGTHLDPARLGQGGSVFRDGRKRVSDHNDCVVCRCENVTLGEIRRTIKEDDAVSSQEVKMLTRAGMGLCGGRACRNVVSRVVAAETGTPVEELVWTRPRFPVRPTAMGDIADPDVDAILDQSKANQDMLSSTEFKVKDR